VIAARFHEGRGRWEPQPSHGPPRKPEETPVATGVGPDGQGLRLKAPADSQTLDRETTGQKAAY
jgi:hypothetical protein